MKKFFSKIAFFTAAAALVCALFSLTALAATSDLLPTGVSNTNPAFIPSGYSDIDENDGWVMIANSAADDTVIIRSKNGALVPPKFCYGVGYKAYFHERMGKLVYLVTSDSFSGSWADEKVYTQEQYDADLAAGKTPRYIRNVDQVGARYMQVYWNTLNSEKVSILEFRLPLSRTESYGVKMNHPGYATWGLEHHETVLFDYRINQSTYLESHVSPFNHAYALVSAGHVEFDVDGSVKFDSEHNTFTPGEVNITAFQKIYSVGSNGKNDFIAMFEGKRNIKKVIFFDSLVNKDGTDADYRVPNSFFKNCTGLREVIFSQELRSVGTNAFQNCCDLMLYLNGGFSDDLTFDLSSGKVSAFNGAKNITFVVKYKSDVQRLHTILDANGITAEIKNTDVFEPALYAHCYTARKESYNGIRGIFSFRPGIEAKNTEAGYTINEYGVVACSLEKYNSLGGTPEAVYNTSNKTIKKMIVYGPTNSANRYINRETKTFCMSVKNIAEKYYNSELCIFAYEKWITPDGETKIYFTQITDPENADKHWTTLYDVTKALVDSGEVTTTSPGYAKVIKPVLDSVATLALAPVKRENFI